MENVNKKILTSCNILHCWNVLELSLLQELVEVGSAVTNQVTVSVVLHVPSLQWDMDKRVALFVSAQFWILEWSGFWGL